MRCTVLALVALTATLAADRSASAEPSRGLAYYENPITLSGVAKRFHLTVAGIAKQNGIEDPDHFNARGLVLPDTPSTRGLPRYVPWTVAPPRQTCAVTPWALRHATKKGCADAYCGDGPAGEQGCLCRDDQGDVHLEIAPQNGASARIPVSLAVFNPYGSSMVDIASVDLDGDGSKETLVSSLDGVSNGIAQEYRTLVVLKDNREIVRYDSGEFTAKTAAVRVGGQCHLASSHYEEVTHPLRGPALHLIERTFAPLGMRMDTELVGRRFSDTTRFVIPFDPLVAGPSASRPEPGTIAQARRDASGELDAVSFRTSSSTRQLEVQANADLRLGDARNRRVFPTEIVWRGLAGRPATLERNASSGTRVLWLAK